VLDCAAFARQSISSAGMPGRLAQRNPAVNRIENTAHLEDLLSEPTEAAVEAMARLAGDLIVLGVAGKMGPTLASMARRASDKAGVRRRVLGVARFTDTRQEAALQAHGVETIRCDLLDPDQLDRLPDAPNVVYLVGMKFGSTGQEARTWATNCWLPGMVCQKYRRSRIIAFSTGNVYGLAPVARGGSVESDSLNPVGDYAMSCLGRERIFEHFSRTYGVPVTVVRLNYATEMRYGVLVDLARRVWEGKPVDVTMGHLNAIWQADASAMALASFGGAASPPFVLNVAGPELLSVRSVAQQFGQLFGRPVTFRGSESADAFLSNGQQGYRLFGYPRVSAEQMIHWIADWVARRGEVWDKPTHFEVRDGQF
jgi:nucleoside-diphosphate-sugar epimerase